MPAWLANFLGGWLTKQVDRLVGWIWKKAKSWFAGKKHKDEVDKYVEAIEALQERARQDIAKFGRVSIETEKALAQMLERRNRNIPFDDAWLQDNSGN